MIRFKRCSFVDSVAVGVLLQAVVGTSSLGAQQTSAAATSVAQSEARESQPPAGDQDRVGPASSRPASDEHATAAQTPPQVVAPPSTVPVAIGPSGRLTGWLQIRGEFRARLEGYQDGAFKPENSDGYLLDRFRINVTVAPSKVAKAVVQLQDARAFDKTTGQMANPVRDILDVRLAYGEFGGARNTVRVGRQELAFGEQRLIGHLNWVNNARSFDGVRATVVRQPFKFDAFAASVVTTQPDAFDKSGSGNRLYGFYGSSTTLLPRATIEPYVFYRASEGLTLETGGVGDIHQTTVGARIVGLLPHGFDYGAEMAEQSGSVATDVVRAWAGHWVAGKSFATAPVRPRPFVEFNYASGDSSPTDGVRGTFDQLYPTGHDKIGLADQVGWRNIEHLRGGVEMKPRPRWQLSSSYHAFWLASGIDALYGANGVAVVRATAGGAGRFVGQEIDAQATYIYSPQLQIAGGYARLAPGEFLKNTTPGESYATSYLMVTYVFVGDKPAPPPGGQR
jgi:hypothetical protein